MIGEFRDDLECSWCSKRLTAKAFSIHASRKWWFPKTIWKWWVFPCECRMSAKNDQLNIDLEKLEKDKARLHEAVRQARAFALAYIEDDMPNPMRHQYSKFIKEMTEALEPGCFEPFKREKP